MTTIQLILLTLNILNKKRKPIYTEMSKIYAFYKSEIESNNISIDDFLLFLTKSSIYRAMLHIKRDSVMALVSSYLYIAAEKSKFRQLKHPSSTR